MFHSKQKKGFYLMKATMGIAKPSSQPLDDRLHDLFPLRMFQVKSIIVCKVVTNNSRGFAVHHAGLWVEESQTEKTCRIICVFACVFACAWGV
jgi:hypothetical protein